MKKFFAATILALTLLIVESSAQAMPVQLYDRGVSYLISEIKNVISEVKEVEPKYDIAIWGTEYYTYQGARFCKVHFGGNKNNTLYFNINNDDSVVWAMVSIPTTATALEQEQSGALAGTILVSVGLTQSEYKSLFKKFQNGFHKAVNQNATKFHEEYTVWASKARRYVVLNVKFENSSANIYIYAHD